MQILDVIVIVFILSKLYQEFDLQVLDVSVLVFILSNCISNHINRRPCPTNIYLQILSVLSVDVDGCMFMCVCVFVFVCVYYMICFVDDKSSIYSFTEQLWKMRQCRKGKLIYRYFLEEKKYSYIKGGF